MKPHSFFTFVFLGLAGASTLQAFDSLHPVRLEGATGTGRTTGEVVVVNLVNPTNEVHEVTLGPFLIPATGDFQGYLIPRSRSLRLQPQERRSIPLSGFCTDIRRAPVPAGEPVLDAGSWLTPSILWEPEPPAPDAEEWIPPAPFLATAFRPADELPAGGRPYQPLFPGTDVPIPWTADINEHPAAMAPFAFKVHEEISRHYDLLVNEGRIRTPYSNNREREREAIIQQTFWLTMSAFAGEDPYGKSDFRARLAEQFETVIGGPLEEQPREQQERFESGADGFWDAIELTGTEAKVVRDNRRPDGNPEPEVVIGPPAAEEPKEAPEPPIMKASRPCEWELAGPDGGITFGKDGVSVTIRGNTLTIDSGDGEPITWEFETDVQDALLSGETSRIRGETTSVQTQSQSDGETRESSSSTDLTISGSDPDDPESSSMHLRFGASVIGPDGKIREYSVSIILDLETCTWIMQVSFEDDLSELASRPPRPANVVARDFAWSDELNRFFAWRTAAFWKKMFSLFAEIVRWRDWLRENPSADDERFIREAWNRWVIKMENAITNARDQGNLTPAQEAALDALEAAMKEAPNDPMDPVYIEAMLQLYTALALSGIAAK